MYTFQMLPLIILTIALKIAQEHSESCITNKLLEFQINFLAKLFLRSNINYKNACTSVKQALWNIHLEFHLVSYYICFIVVFLTAFRIRIFLGSTFVI